MAYFGEESDALITGLLTANPCLDLFLWDKAVLIFRLEVGRWVDIGKPLVVIELFPVENTIGLEVLFLEFCLFDFLLFSLFCLF